MPLLELQKAFIRPLDNDAMNAVFFTCSISRHMHPDKEGETFEHWSAFFTVRIDSTLVRFHNLEWDLRLVKFEEKLNLIISTTESYLAELRKRLIKPARKKKVMRVWLNPDKDTGFTGRCAWEMDEKGNGNYQLGDCHRGIAIWAYPHEDYSIEGDKTIKGQFTQFEKLLEPIEDIVTESKKAIETIHRLRARLDSGELDTQ